LPRGRDYHESGCPTLHGFEAWVLLPPTSGDSSLASRPSVLRSPAPDRLRRTRNAGSCSTPTVAVQAPVLASRDCGACSAAFPLASCLRTDEIAEPRLPDPAANRLQHTPNAEPHSESDFVLDAVESSLSCGACVPPLGIIRCSAFGCDVRDRHQAEHCFQLRYTFLKGSLFQ